jgi:Amt family ammonium transporter
LKGIAALAIVNTNVAAASSMFIWIILDIINGKSRGQNTIFVSIHGVCSAIVVGLVVVTPAAGYIQPGYAILMGLIGGSAIYLFLTGKKHFFHIDDTLDVFSCHGLGGFIGIFLTGLFCQTDVNNNGKNGAFYGNPIQLGYQLLGILITIAYSAACTAVILLPMHFTIGIRINRFDQVRGLDSVSHGVIGLEQLQKIQQMKLTTMKGVKRQSA